MSFTICFTPLFTIAAPVLVIWFAHRRFDFWRRARLTWLSLSLWGLSLLPVCQVLLTAVIALLATPKTAVSAHIPFSAEINQAAAAHGLDPALLAGLVKIESGFNPTATSAAGAMGLTQIMPATAAELGLSAPYNPQVNLEAGARYLAWLINQFGSTESALMAYHGGPGRIASGAIRPIDRQYARDVLAAYGQYQIVALVPDQATITDIPARLTPFKGVDYTTGCGSPIPSPATGTVTAVGFDGYIGEYGSNNSYLIVNDGQREIILMHGHYTAVVGQSVIIGQIIGREASIGNSTGCHTDISIRSIQ